MLGTFLVLIAAALGVAAAWFPWWGVASLAEGDRRPAPRRSRS